MLCLFFKQQCVRFDPYRIAQILIRTYPSSTQDAAVRTVLVFVKEPEQTILPFLVIRTVENCTQSDDGKIITKALNTEIFNIKTDYTFYTGTNFIHRTRYMLYYLPDLVS